jgi:hypothetical protein
MDRSIMNLPEWHGRRRGTATSLVTAAVLLVAITVPAFAATDAPEATPAPEAAPTATPAPNVPDPEVLFDFRSRPDLVPPRLTIEAMDAAGDDALFITPRFGGSGEGLMIYDAAGELVWLHRVPGRTALGLRPIEYEGEPALTWWEGVIDRGLGDGDFVIADQSYQEVARLRSVRYPADLHEFLVNADGTAYVFALEQVEIDGQLIDDYLVQQLDIASGQRLWEWRASDHIPLSESTDPIPDGEPWDYVHFNSISLDGDGDLILSARHTDAVYNVSRETGEIVWRLGGPASDFELPEELVFRRQHDAQWHTDGTISIFDNATDDNADEAQPRGIVLRLDEADGTVELVRELAPPRTTNSSSQGNFELADEGTATVGWGSSNLFTGYGSDGSVVLDGAMPGGFSSYRAYRAPWTGLPVDRPLLAIDQDENGQMTAAVSWNGATEVDSWQLLTGEAADNLGEAGEPVPRVGFETAIELPDARVVEIVALDAEGQPLGSTGPVAVEDELDDPVPAG